MKSQTTQERLGIEVLPDIMYMRLKIVNICFIGNPDQASEWVLVDTGLGGSAAEIIQAAEERFGKKKAPAAIVLTHGHFDHVGSVQELVDFWNVSVYAHELELPYLTGQDDYPPGDPTVGGGLMAALSPLYPHKGIDLGKSVRSLPKEGRIPHLPQWKWIHTPGHSPGHISLFRERDSALIAGDAFITVKQESALAVLTQDKEIQGPPTYFTPDWECARNSVKKLRDLRPSVAVTGHGVPLIGQELSAGLDTLVENFDTMAIPKQGRYVLKK